MPIALQQPEFISGTIVALYKTEDVRSANNEERTDITKLAVRWIVNFDHVDAADAPTLLGKE